MMKDTDWLPAPEDPFTWPAGMTRKFRASLEGMMHGEVLLRHEVEAQGRAMIKMLRRHMELEESEVFPLADRQLIADDWRAVADDAPKYNDPLFGDPDPARFRTLYQHLVGELDLGGEGK